MAKKKVTKKVVGNQFVFTGDPVGGCDPLTTNYRGYQFELNGKPVPITDPAVAMKLKTHSHFTEK